MNLSDRLALIASICSKRACLPRVNRVNAYVPPLPADEDEEKGLARVHNDDESIADHEPEDGSPMVSPELARALRDPEILRPDGQTTGRAKRDETDGILLSRAERKQLEQDRLTYRHRFALWIPPRTISDLIRA